MLTKYKKLSDIDNDPRFGNITIYFHEDNNELKVMSKEEKSSNEEEFRMLSKFVRERKEMTHPNILRMVDIQSDPESLRTVLFFEFNQSIVEVPKLEFAELARMFRDILQAISFLQSKKMAHGDLKPDYIARHKLEDKFILLDKLKDDPNGIQSQLSNIQNYKSLYMHPIIFEKLIKQIFKFKYNAFKSETFSLAMICLSKYMDIQIYYDFYKSKFNGKQFVQDVS